MKLLICGSRGFTKLSMITKALSDMSERPSAIISGCARGADTLAITAAKEIGIPIERYPADWTKGKMAGYMRNQTMLTEGKPDEVWAFYDSHKRTRGTSNMIYIAQKAGIKTREFFANI